MSSNHVRLAMDPGSILVTLGVKQNEMPVQQGALSRHSFTTAGNLPSTNSPTLMFLGENPNGYCENMPDL